MCGNTGTTRSGRACYPQNQIMLYMPKSRFEVRDGPTRGVWRGIRRSKIYERRIFLVLTSESSTRERQKVTHVHCRAARALARLPSMSVQIQMQVQYGVQRSIHRAATSAQQPKGGVSLSL